MSKEQLLSPDTMDLLKKFHGLVMVKDGPLLGIEQKKEIPYLLLPSHVASPSYVSLLEDFHSP